MKQALIGKRPVPRKRFPRFLLLSVVGAGALASSVASAAITGAGGSSAVFDAVGPAGLKIEGKTTQVNVAQQDDNVVVTVAAGTFDTGIELRNRHMRDKYLETAKYPNAVLTVARAALLFPADGADSAGSVAGSLSLHGQTRAVTVNYKAHRAGDTYAVSGTTHVKMTDFGIDQPSYLGLAVKPDVDIVVTFNAKDS